MPTRRSILESAGAVSALAFIGRGWAPAEALPFVTPLPVPDLQVARARDGRIDLIAAKAQHAFAPGRSAATYGYSASFLGPVLMLHTGDEVQFSVENRLDHDTTAHWHGVLAPAAVDGGPHLVIKPGENWRPVLKINQPEATAWYHAHPHGDSGRQVYMGLAGMVIHQGWDRRKDLDFQSPMASMTCRSFCRTGPLTPAARSNTPLRDRR